MTEKKRYSYLFAKSERICSAKEIENLFKEGKSALAYPIKMVFLSKPRTSESIDAKVGFSVSKKRFKSAVKRNRIKRLMREAYRKNKHLLHTQNNAFYCFFIYIEGKIVDYKVVEKAVVKLMSKINNANID